jgi:Ni,Fe-hydrogenase III small subunit
MIFLKKQFPEVIGAIDGCHIEIKALIKSAYDQGC